MVPFIFFLRVRFYVGSGLLILSSKVQQFYYTELRQKVLHSQSRHQEALFFQLAASALQAEVGDLVQGEGRQDRKCEHYFLPEDYFPSWLIKRRGRDYLLQHGPVLHGELRGVSRSQAILRFIKEVGSLQDGAVTFYRVRQEKKKPRSLIVLGVSLTGVHISEEVEGMRRALFDFSWTDIDRFTFQVGPKGHTLVCSRFTHATAAFPLYSCLTLTLQGSRFEITAVGSLCLPKLVYYTHSAFHSKHILRHLSDSHQLHINTRDAVSYIQQLEDVQASHFYKEAYICDTTCLTERLRCHNLTSSMSDCSVVVETAPAWTKEEEEEDEGSPSEAELWENEPGEVFVDSPAEMSWLTELLYGVSVDGPLVLPSSHWAVNMEMKQVLWRRAGEGESLD
ncbi:FERM domain-containing protein 6-like isoform X2 [Leuresthes tenuis]|uniref:FERM domain-containing protein 6-like isoform X2 n=1 Tax=Leuresthes tenuis TaxID=355514 RepID=UPI003B511B05